MRINLKTHNIELTPAITDYINKKMDRVKKSLHEKEEDESFIDVEVGITTAHHQSGDIFFAKAQCEHGGTVYSVHEGKR